jgi:hypothetical protein
VRHLNLLIERGPECFQTPGPLGRPASVSDDDGPSTNHPSGGRLRANQSGVFKSIEVYVVFIVPGTLTDFAGYEFTNNRNNIYCGVTTFYVNCLHESCSEVFRFCSFTELSFDYLRDHLYSVSRGQSLSDCCSTY